MKGEFKINSGVFNPAPDGYHDKARSMDVNTRRCVEKVVNYWKETGRLPSLPKFRGPRLAEGISLRFYCEQTFVARGSD